MQAINIS